MGALQNQRREKFAFAVAVRGMSSRDAVVFAGYKPGKHAKNYGSMLKRDPQVAARIEELRKRVQDESIEQAVWQTNDVLDKLGKIVADAWQGQPILNRDGTSSGRRKRDYLAMTRALELYGKQLGMFRQQIEIGRPEDYALEQYDEEELMILKEAHDRINAKRAAARERANGGASAGEAADLQALPEAGALSSPGGGED